MQVVQCLCYVQGIDKDSDSLSPDCNRSRVPQWRQKKKDVLQFACKSDISWLIASLPWLEGDYSGFRDKTVGQTGISVHHVITTTFEECFKEQEDSVWIAQSCFTHTILITTAVFRVELYVCIVPAPDFQPSQYRECVTELPWEDPTVSGTTRRENVATHTASSFTVQIFFPSFPFN